MHYSVPEVIALKLRKYQGKITQVDYNPTPIKDLKTLTRAYKLEPAIFTDDEGCHRFKGLKYEDERLATNNNFKIANTKSFYTKELLNEWARCRDDIIYFAENYCCVENADDASGLVYAKLRPYQKIMLKMMYENKECIFKVGRQLGKTTISSILLAHLLTFNSRKKIGVMAQNANQACEIVDRTKRIIEYLPDFLQPGVARSSRDHLLLDNGCAITGFSSDPDAMRGKSFLYLYVDEAAYVDNWKLIEKTIRPIFSRWRDSKLILTSTPNGMNHFYDIWQNAVENKNNFKYFAADWRADETRLFNKKGVFDNGKEWHATEYNYDAALFRQEHACDFIGSSETLINADTLKKLQCKDYEPFEAVKGCVVRVYKEPDENNHYIAAVDLATGAGKDCTAITVVDATNNELVATWRDNTSDVEKVSDLLVSLCSYYDAFIVVEMNIGALASKLIDLLKSKEYEKLYLDEKKLNGTQMLPHTKLLACQAMKKAIETGFEVPDIDMIDEFMRFVKNGRTFCAESGNDDLVMALANYFLAIQNEYFCNYVANYEDDDAFFAVYRYGGWCDNESDLQKSRNMHYAQYGNENWGTMSSGNDVWWR
ncbi:terminase family protein [Vibrio parahaemolyticus]